MTPCPVFHPRRALGPLLLAIGLLESPAAEARLTLVASETPATLPEGLDAVSHLLLSSDDRRLFATSPSEDTVASYVRDPTTGRLAFADVARDGVGGADGIGVPGHPGIDPRGRHLYVPGTGENALAVFSIGAAGALTFVEMQREGFAGVVGLGAPRVARVSPDGRFVYVGGAAEIAIFARSEATGALDWVGQAVLPYAYPMSDLVFAPGGATLHAGVYDRIYAYARNASTGQLTLVDTEQSGVGGVPGFFPISMAASRDGSRLYVGAETGLLVFSRAPNGTLGFAQIEPLLGTNARVALAADGSGVWTSSSWTQGTGSPLTWRQDFHPIDPATGLLGAGEPALVQDKDITSGHIAASRDGRHLYVSDGLNDTIDVASVDPLAFVERQGDGAAGVDGLDGARSPAVSPDGRHVYVASYIDDGVAVFSRDATTGELDFVELERDGTGTALNGATHVTISPDGKHLYVCAYIDDAVTVFDRDAASGALTFNQDHRDGLSAPGLNFASASAVSPDGKHLYVTAPNDDAVTVFLRNATIGGLTFVEEHRHDGIGALLDGAGDVAVSPNGRHVLVTSTTSSSITSFLRDATTGALDSAVTVIAIESPRGITISRDGRHVYVVGDAGDSLAAFALSADGGLGFVGTIHDGDGLVSGLDGARDVEVTADGRHVVVSGALADAIAVFRRDPQTGVLGYAQIERDSDVDGLFAPQGIAASPDGRHVYVAGQNDDALVVFAPEPATALAPLAACAALAALADRRRRVASNPA